MCTQRYYITPFQRAQVPVNNIPFLCDICTYTKSVQGLRLHTHTSHKQQEAQNSHTIRLAGKTGEVPMCVDVDIEVEQNSLTSGPERGRQANEHRFNMSTRIHDIKE